MAANQESLGQRVVHLVQGGWRSREVLEAEYPERADAIDEDRVMLCGWSSVVHREGLALANLAMSPSTRVELLAQMPGLLEKLPVWQKARAHEELMTATLFARGLAEALSVQRVAIERVAEEQVGDLGPIWAALAEASVPNASGASQQELLKGVGEAMIAHLRALVGIARDLEVQIGIPFDGSGN